MALIGRATAAATAAFATEHAELVYNPIGNSGLLVGQVGFGSYRVGPNDSVQRDALQAAILAGVNLIDTSSNYLDGDSERLVGEVIAELVESEVVGRQDLFVVTKAGYLQGQVFRQSQERKKAGKRWPDLVEYAPGLEYCLHPEFLADQLDRSLERLNLTTVDGFLLSNPELYLAWAEKAGADAAVAASEIRRRLQLSFGYLEEEARRGRIQFYGVSSNTFAEANEAFRFIDLGVLWQIAGQVARDGADHHFRLIELPVNLLESAAVWRANQADGSTVLEFARSHEVSVLTNRPLNAIRHGVLLRLADVPAPAPPADPQQIMEQVDALAQVESRFQREVLPALPFGEPARQSLASRLAVGQSLQGKWTQFGTYHNWRYIQVPSFLQRVQAVVTFFGNWREAPAELRTWLDGYVEAVNRNTAAIGAYYQTVSSAQSGLIKGLAAQADPDWQAATLSQSAVRAVRSTAGVTSVLAGMRRPVYVRELLADLAQTVAVEERLGSWRTLDADLQRFL